MAQSKTAAPSGKNVRRIICEHVSFDAKEAYKRLRTNVLFSFSDEKPCHIIGLTSSAPGEGKSVTAASLAYSLAQTDRKVLLIEGDMRRPSLHTLLSMEIQPGLSNYLSQINLQGNLFQKYLPSDESLPFYFLASGEIPPNPAELLDSGRMKMLLEKNSELFDYIIIDLPPVGAVTDALTVAGMVDGMIVVVHENVTPYGFLSETLTQLSYTDCRILGVVMNGVDLSGSKYGSRYGGRYGKYSSYSHYYNYTSEKGK